MGLSLATSIAFSQDVEVKNVIAAQNFNDIIVSYDLLSENASQKFTVELYCSTNGGIVFGDPLNTVEGDVGFNISPGEGKKITWDVLEEVNQFVYDDVVFKVKATANAGGIVDLVLIEGGSFIMGNENGQEDEKPEHEVQLSNFYISKYEITVKQYEEFCKKSGKEMPESNSEWLDDHPMTYISWEDAKEYCSWLSEMTGEKYRLPTEAEWEYVAKGGIHGSSNTEPSKNEIDNYAWHKGNTGGYAHYEVGKLKPNDLGIYDIIGNVWEWCEDWYGKTYYAYAPGFNPPGPPRGKTKVARGGSWREPGDIITETYRFYQSPTSRTNYVGLRVVKEP
jgi:formylglycine-generating enzyme required for sulfatase activity